MTNEDVLERAARVRAAMFGGTQGVSTLPEDVSDWINRAIFGEIWSREELDLRSRSCLTIGMLIALNRPAELQAHFRAGMNNGLSLSELEEMCFHAIGYCGAPAGIEAFRALHEVTGS